MSGALDDGRDDGDERGVREQDRFLPIANISRIMKKALPPNAKIAKDAKETVQECVSEFISFITSEYALAPPQAAFRVLRADVQGTGWVLRGFLVCQGLGESLGACWDRASDKCQREKRKTINGDDLLWAMSTLGFEDYVEPLKLYLAKYREGEKQNMQKQPGGGAAATSDVRKEGMEEVTYMQTNMYMPHHQPHH